MRGKDISHISILLTRAFVTEEFICIYLLKISIILDFNNDQIIVAIKHIETLQNLQFQRFQIKVDFHHQIISFNVIFSMTYPSLSIQIYLNDSKQLSKIKLLHVRFYPHQHLHGNNFQKCIARLIEI